MDHPLTLHRRVVDLCLEILHLQSFDDRQLDLLDDVVDFLIDLEYDDDFGENVIQVLMDHVFERTAPSMMLIIAVRDHVLSDALEQARTLGLTFEWTSDIDDPRIALEALRGKVETLAGDRLGDPEAALDVLLGVDAVARRRPKKPTPEDLSRRVDRFFESAHEDIRRRRLRTLVDAQQN